MNALAFRYCFVARSPRAVLVALVIRRIAFAGGRRPRHATRGLA